MNYKDWLRIQTYAMTGMAAMAIALAIVVTVNGSINTIQFFNNNKSSETTTINNKIK